MDVAGGEVALFVIGAVMLVTSGGLFAITAHRKTNQEVIGTIGAFFLAGGVFLGFIGATNAQSRTHDLEERGRLAEMRRAIAGKPYSNLQYNAGLVSSPWVRFTDEEGCWATITFTHVNGVLKPAGPPVRDSEGQPYRDCYDRRTILRQPK